MKSVGQIFLKIKKYNHGLKGDLRSVLFIYCRFIFIMACMAKLVLFVVVVIVLFFPFF